MKPIKRLYINLLTALTAILAMAGLSSCSMMTEEEPDCTPYYKVRFRFDRNMLYADAFPSQVGEVDLYVFDQEGNLVWKGHEEGEILTQEGYLMDLPVPPGTYDLVAWCHKRHKNAAGFNLTGGDNPLHVNHVNHVKMKMTRGYEAGKAHSSTDLHALFHGKLTACELPDRWGTHIVTVPLTKNTNSIRIQLVHLSGKEIEKDDFDFMITDANGHLDHDNSILEDEEVEYRAWARRKGIANMLLPSGDENQGGSITPLEAGSRSVTPIHTIMAEFTTSRLQTCNNPILTIIRKSDGEKVVSIPIIEYFLMVKGEYHRPMEDDEYLDRQDEYNMTFFMHDDGSWYDSVIDILSWRVVRQSTDL